MDIMWVSGAQDPGSIPGGATKSRMKNRAKAKCSFCFLLHSHSLYHSFLIHYPNPKYNESEVFILLFTSFSFSLFSYPKPNPKYKKSEAFAVFLNHSAPKNQLKGQN